MQQSGKSTCSVKRCAHHVAKWSRGVSSDVATSTIIEELSDSVLSYAVFLRRSGGRGLIVTPIQDGNFSARTSDSDGLPECGIDVIDFVPDIRVEDKIHAAIRKRQVRRRPLVKRNVPGGVRSIELEPQEAEHFGLQIDGEYVAGRTYRVAERNGEVSSTCAHIRDSQPFTEGQPCQNLGRRKPFQPLGVFEFMGMGVLEDAIVHAGLRDDPAENWVLPLEMVFHFFVETRRSRKRFVRWERPTWARATGSRRGTG